MTRLAKEGAYSTFDKFCGNTRLNLLGSFDQHFMVRRKELQM